MPQTSKTGMAPSLVFEKIKGKFLRLRLIWADGGYAGPLIEWVKNACGWLLEIVKRDPKATGFQLLPRRWVVERTFGWFGCYRRLSRDYEFQTDTSENMILIAMIQLMVHRLTRNNSAIIPASISKTGS